MSSVPDRSDVAEEYTWDLSDLYADDEEWEAAFEAVEERLEELSAYEGRVTEDAETLQAVLEFRESIMREVANVAAYARMRRDEDTTNPSMVSRSTDCSSGSMKLAALEASADSDCARAASAWYAWFVVSSSRRIRA